MTLVLATAATGCSIEEQKMAMRDVYDSPAECHAEWAGDDASCEVVMEPATETTPGAVRSGVGYFRPRYYGPPYWQGQRPGGTVSKSGQSVQIGSRASGSRSSPSASSRSSSSRSSSTSRGGFGGSSASRGASS
jgi:hypothetical protein